MPLLPSPELGSLRSREGQSDDGGRFDAQGTGWRAVKCFDPTQDHQLRKRWAGLDLPLKSECAVIEED